MADIQNPSFVDLLKSAVTEPGYLHAAFTRFHNYSLGNQLLAWMQCLERGLEPGPMATYATWQSLGRQVRKGAKALVLCQPVTIKRTAVDEQTGDEREIPFTRFTFRPKWFVLAQTDGLAYVAPAPPTWDKANALAALNVTEIPFDLMNGNVQGFARDRSVAISPVAVAPFETLVHELAHIVLGHTAELQLSTSDRTPKNIMEVEAESVALLVLGSLNEPGLGACRGYVQHWLQGQEIPERSAQRIFKAADTILRAGRVQTADAVLAAA